MASNVYSRYLNLLKPYGAVYNDDIGLIAVRSALVARVPTVYVRMGKNKLPIIGEWVNPHYLIISDRTLTRSAYIAVPSSSYVKILVRSSWEAKFPSAAWEWLCSAWWTKRLPWALPSACIVLHSDNILSSKGTASSKTPCRILETTWISCLARKCEPFVGLILRSLLNTSFDSLERFLTGYDTATGRMSFQNTKYTTQTYAQMGRFMRRSVNATVTDEDDIATILSEEWLNRLRHFMGMHKRTIGTFLVTFNRSCT